MHITRQVIAEIHERLRREGPLECPNYRTPLTAQDLGRHVSLLPTLYSDRATMILVSWSCAEALLQETLDWWYYCRDSESQPLFKSRIGEDLFVDGYVGDLMGTPVIASIYASREYGLFTTQPEPLKIESDKHDSILVYWAT